MITPLILVTPEIAQITVPRNKINIPGHDPIPLPDGETARLALNGYPDVYGQNAQYLDAISEANGAPIIVGSRRDEQQLRATYDASKGIFLPGGYDVDPAFYGEVPIDGMTDPSEISEERDWAERLLVQWANQDKKPLLTVCRGMQMMNVAMGGTLWQDLDKQRRSPSEPGYTDHRASGSAMKQEGHTDHLAHELQVVKDSTLAAILGTNVVMTNSRHHQGVRAIGNGLRAAGHAPDGLVEAVESVDANRFAIGVQSHPESIVTSTSNSPELLTAAEAWKKLFGAFIIAASEY